ncbi:GNAT family N-acetyltransferase [Devosia sp. PTR5]|uniref:GNAT family N-acetyltransferase n=2 Tax=Devosia oryzisoli TaxID=2774138 RepID=A0A927ITY1_9HYPH|nr:GNAT family N-acetyltransferase [Devosia oryzisoli]MBD8066362.1 GNAT family N-acetyltransferase [Devosia oryzisoli]
MTGYDIAEVFAIANRVHPELFESQAVLAEKQALYRNGCYVLEVSERPAGYVLSHPWRFGEVPALDGLIGALTDDADTYYIHDLALLPLTRGIGAAGKIVEALAKHARVLGLDSMTLVAVNSSRPFWERHGFASETAPQLDADLAGYGPDARYMVRRLAD